MSENTVERRSFLTPLLQLTSFRLFLSGLGVLCVVVLAAAFTYQAPLPDNTVSLPIRVIPLDGTTPGTTTITVGVSDPSGVETLYLKGHALGYHMSEWTENGTPDWDGGTGGTDPNDRYDQKASFRINNGSWVDLTNENVTCKYPEKLYGCIAGAFQTIRLEVPISETGALDSGTNTITFRFNGTEGVSSGYRILDVELRRSGDSDAIDGTTFEYEDPETWTSPEGYNNSSAISEGETLFKKQGILVGEAILSPTREKSSLTASCANCHARDGRDLKYFNYSNQSIVARSRFHGLTESQGKKIAAYIRSIDLELPNYDCNGDGTPESRETVCGAWPWNPPYQPGPGLDEKPVEWWAAGAGVDAVLEDDIDAFQYAKQAYQSGNTDTDSSLNVREFPLAVQFPDWNNWLPDIAPQEFRSDWESTDLYQKLVNGIPPQIDTPTDVEGLVDETASNTCSNFLKGLYGTMSSARYPSTEKNGDSNPIARFTKETSKRQWNVVRLWELMTKYKLEDKGKEMFLQGEQPCGRKQFFADRSWPKKNMDLFLVSPHMIQRSQSSCAYRSSKKCKYYSSIWYELQLVVNMGQRGRTGNGGPMDWNYQGSLERSSTFSGHSQFLRGWRNLIANWQNRNIGNPWRGFNTSPSQFFKFRQSHWAGGTQGLIYRTNQYNYGGEGINLTKRRKLTEWALEEFAEKIWAHPFDEWLVCPEDNPDCSDGKLEPSTVSPPRDAGIGSIDQLKYDDKFYKGLATVANENVRPTLLDSLARWGEHFWPKGDFEQWMCESNGGPLECASTTVSTQSIGLSPGWNLVSSRVQPSNDSMSAIFSNVETDLKVVQNQQGDAYDPTSGGDALTTWDARQGYRVYMNATGTITVDGTALNSPTFDLNKGWNLVPFYPSREMPVEDAFSPISDKIEVVKDENGNAYIPGLGLNMIGTLKPGRAYKVFLSSSASFSYP